jgi:membrane-bound serine protease (ClpP class)
MMDSLLLAYILIGIGLLLLVAEMFIPSWGLFFVLAIAALVGGVWIIFTEDSSTGWVTLVGLVVLVPIVGGVAFHYWPKTPWGRRMLMSGPEEDATVATMPVNLALEQLRGRTGRAVSALRPAGVADFDGRRVDVLTEGMMVEAGTWVRCIDVRAGRVVVRAIDKPDLNQLENISFD